MRNLIRTFALAFAAALLLAPATSARAETLPVANPEPGVITVWEPCMPGTGVTVFLDFGNFRDGAVWVKCAPNAGGQSGVHVLFDAGLDPVGTVQYGLGFICRLAGIPENPVGDYHDPCPYTPGGSQYWSYWHGVPGGAWGYSGVGATGWTAANGSVEGWSMTDRPAGLAPFNGLMPMDARGPMFSLPGEQPSSARALGKASDWLAAEVGLRRLSSLQLAQQLEAAIALRQAGQPISRFDGVLERLLYRRAWFKWYTIGTPGQPDFRLTEPVALARLIRFLVAMEIDPRDFEGHDLIAELASAFTAQGTYLQGSNSRESELSAEFAEMLAEMGLLSQAVGERFLARITALPANATTATAAGQLAALAAIRRADPNWLDRAGVNAKIAEAVALIEGRQLDGGAIAANATPNPDPLTLNHAELARAGRALALAGRAHSARRVARWLSRMQVTAVLAGDGPGVGVIGAFAPTYQLLSQTVQVGPPLEYPIEATYETLRLLAQADYRDRVDATVGTGEALTVRSTSAVVTGRVDPGTLRQRIEVEYGTSTRYGEIVVAGELGPDDDPRLFEAELAGLTPGTTYHYRFVAVDRDGIRVRGADGTFTTNPAPAVPDPPAGEGSSPEAVAPEAVAPQGESAEDGGTPGSPVRISLKGAVRPARGILPVNRRGVVAIAAMRCPAAVACHVSTPRRVRVVVAGKGYRARVLTSRRIAPGKRAQVRLRLPRDARRQLREVGRGRVVLRTAMYTGEGARRVVRLRVRLAAS